MLRSSLSRLLHARDPGRPERGCDSPTRRRTRSSSASPLRSRLRAELARDHPLLDVQLFRQLGPDDRVGQPVRRLALMFALFLVLVQFLRRSSGARRSALIRLFPMAVMIIPLSTISTTMARRGYRRTVASGMITLAQIMLLAFFADPAAGYTPCRPVLLVIVPIRLSMTLTTAITSSLTEDEQGRVHARRHGPRDRRSGRACPDRDRSSTPVTGPTSPTPPTPSRGCR